MSTDGREQWLLRRMRAVADCPSENFRALLEAGEIDPHTGLRNHDWSGLSFAAEDLRGMDFTRSKLDGCDFSGAQIAGARFDQARLGAVVHDPARDPTLPALHGGIANLRTAADWAEYRQTWTRAQSSSPSDDHLSVGAIFCDAPGIAPEMVVVPAGTFIMGTSPGEVAAMGSKLRRVEHGVPEHRVTIGCSIAVGRFAVTFEEWDAAQEHREWREHSGLEPRLPIAEWGRSRQPVTDVSWRDASAYCHWLTAITGKPYRLLSEAEWEYCCRAGTTTYYSTGDSITNTQARFLDPKWTSDNNVGEGTTEVGSYPPNAWGLHDMHGNVWEWCQDEWHTSYHGAPDDGSAWESRAEGGRRMTRGGSWGLDAQNLTSSSRSASAREVSDAGRFRGVGFRIARTVAH